MPGKMIFRFPIKTWWRVLPDTRTLMLAKESSPALTELRESYQRQFGNLP